MPRRGDSCSPETRARLSRAGVRAWEKRREAARVRPRDLERLRRSGTVSESLRPLLEIAEEEAAELVSALGGPDEISPQRRAIVEDLVAVGVVLRAELTRFLQSGDPDAGARVGTLAGARRASLSALGLERRAREVFDPTLPLTVEWATPDPEGAQDTPDGTNGEARGSEVAPDDERAVEGDAT